jgi:hypothetical protein
MNERGLRDALRALLFNQAAPGAGHQRAAALARSAGRDFGGEDGGRVSFD